MKDRLRSLPKAALIGVGALMLSTLGIQAADLVRGVDSSLSGLLSESGGPCGPNAAQVLNGPYSFCMDTYEASPGESCPVASPGNELESTKNLRTASCVADSKPNVMPWRFVSLTDAQQLCARTGKRLPTSEEWYIVARGVSNPDSCAIDTSGNAPVPTGSVDCVSANGVKDTIGNVWEWMDETVNDGVYDERTLPESGYVSMVDGDGMVVETSDAPSADFGDDYAWINSAGVRGILRGGFYGSKSDAGIFSQNLSVAPNLKTGGIGFRCVQDL